MNYLTPKTRKEVLELLVNGLKRLEYRGYDSAGLAIDSNDGRDIVLVKRTGKVQFLEDAINDGTLNCTCNTFLFRHFSVISNHVTNRYRLICCNFFFQMHVQPATRAKQRQNPSYTVTLASRIHVGPHTVCPAKLIRIHSDPTMKIHLSSCTMASSPTTKT